MTVATLETKIEYTGDASTLTFALDFPFVDDSCLKAYRRNSAGVSTPITIADTTGGSQRTGWGVTLAEPVGVGYTLKIIRDTPIFQPKRYGENDPFPARSHEIGLDRLTMIIQEIIAGRSGGTAGVNPATFSQGLELPLSESLGPNEIGYATDSETIILKLADGSIVRFHIPSGGTGGSVNAKVIVESIPANQSVTIPSYDFVTLAETDLPAGFFNSHEFLDIDVPVLVTTGAPSGYLQIIGYIGATSIFGTLSTGSPSLSNPAKVRIFADKIAGKVTASCEALKESDPVNVNTGWETTVDFAAALTVSIKAMHLGAGSLAAKTGVCAFSTYEAVSLGGGASLVGTAGGDLSGSFPAPSVVGIKGSAIPTLSPGVLTWTGSAWEFVNVDPRPVFEVENFPYGQYTIAKDDEEDMWHPSGCFCWIHPAENWSRIKYIKTRNVGGPGTPTGKFAIWAGDASNALTKIHEGDTAFTVIDLDLDVSSYNFVGVTMDPLPSGVPEPVAVMKLSTGIATGSGFANVAAFIGTHVHGDAFGSFPVIIAEEPKYFVNKWMALGVVK